MMDSFRSFCEIDYDTWKAAAPGGGVTCPACRGEGEVDNEKCDLCKGTGEVDERTAKQWYDELRNDY